MDDRPRYTVHRTAWEHGEVLDIRIGSMSIGTTQTHNDGPTDALGMVIDYLELNNHPARPEYIEFAPPLARKPRR